VGQHVERHRRCIRVTAGVNNPAEPPPSAVSPGAAAETPTLLAIARRHSCGSAISSRHPGALQQQAGQEPEHARAEHDDPVAIAVPGVERHLQRRLD